MLYKSTASDVREQLIFQNKISQIRRQISKQHCEMFSSTKERTQSKNHLVYSSSFSGTFFYLTIKRVMKDNRRIALCSTSRKLRTEHRHVRGDATVNVFVALASRLPLVTHDSAHINYIQSDCKCIFEYSQYAQWIRRRHYRRETRL